MEFVCLFVCIIITSLQDSLLGTAPVSQGITQNIKLKSDKYGNRHADGATRKQIILRPGSSSSVTPTYCI
jgi:hypothetical protein